ncbi:hypothetical protein Tco_0069444, partial [Tanacetum coccineum]
MVSSEEEEVLVEDASEQGRNDANAEIFNVDTLAGDEVFAEQKVAAKDLTVDEVTLAQALAALKSAKPKPKGDIIEEPSVPVSVASTKVTASAMTKDKGKEKMVEPEKLMKKKNQVSFDKEVALKLQAEFDKEERLIKADYLMAERLQAREQEELTIEEEATLFQQLLKKKGKHFAAKRAEEKK